MLAIANAPITPLNMGPSVCPTSIIVLKKPIEAPTKPDGTSSHISGEVDEVTNAKPKPKPTAKTISNGNEVVNGTASSIKALTTAPKAIGKRLPFLSEVLPMAGLATIIAIVRALRIGP